MKRKLRKSLSWLLTVAMIFSLVFGAIPTASAVGSEGITDITGEGVYDGIGNVEFRLYTTDAYKLLKLADPTITADTTINSVTLLLKEEYSGNNHFTLVGGLGTKIPTNHFTNSITNTNGKANPSNITGIEITYDGEKTVTIQASDLRLESDIVTTPGVEWNAVYEIKSSNDEECVVAFYDNGETDAGAIAGYELYAVRIVNSGETVGRDDFPPAPEHISYSFVSWNDEPDGEGTPFDYDTVVTSDMNIYARNVSGLDVHTGTVIHVMNEDNALLNRYIELYNEYPNNEDISLADFTQDVMDSMKVTIHGEGTEATNPDYWLSGLEGQHNGWIDDDYFLVLNYNAELLPEGHYHNTHIPATEISGITVEATIDGKTVSVYISRGSEEGQISVSPTDIATEWRLVLNGSSSPSEGNDITNFTKELVMSEETTPEGITGIQYPENGVVIVPESGSVTLLYKLTVTGDVGAAYTITDPNVTVVSGELSGTLETATEEIYVTKTFSATDIQSGVLTNSATIAAGADTEVTDGNTDDDTATVPAEIKPDGPTEDELNTIFNDQIRVICANNHRTADYSPSDVANGVTAGTVTKDENNAWICEVTIDKNAFAQKYGSDLGETHVLAESETASEEVTLVYREGEWTTSDTLPIEINVVCTNPDVDAIQVVMSDGVQALYDTLGIPPIHTGRWTHVDTQKAPLDYIPMGDDGWENGELIFGTTANDITGVTLGDSDDKADQFWFPMDHDNGIYAQLEVSYGYTRNPADILELGQEYYTLILYCQLVEEQPDEPEMPDAPDLDGKDKDLLEDKIVVDCTNNTVNHEDGKYGYINGGITTPTEGVTESNGTYTYKVTVVADPYVTKYNTGTNVTHADATFKDNKNTITLTWTPNADGTGGSWKADNGVTIIVKCAAPETPTLKHTVKVSVENGTASFAGQSGVTEFSVLDGEDAVITFTPKEGYVLESATIDDDDYTIFFNEKGETTYTLKTIGDDMTVVVVYKLDIPTPTFEDDLAGQNIEVLVKCTSDTAVNHWSKDYLLEKHAVSEPDLYEKDGEYFADFTVYAASYVDRYNVDGSYTGNDKHSTTDSGQATITLVWNAKDEEWACITPADKVITFLVKCGASDTPEAPSNEEIPQILAGKPVLIKCVNENRKHDLADQTYGLMDGSYKVMGVNESNGTWTCTVEINIEQYLKAFIEKTGSVIHVESGAATQQVVLTWDRDAGLWKAPADDEYAATFEVTCDPTVVGSYDLTFNANGGKIVKNGSAVDAYTENDLKVGKYTLSTYVSKTELIYDGKGEKVIFAGWTTEKPSEEVYSYNDADIPEIVETVTIENQPVTVWAVWGYDEDEDGVADINEIIVTPADITIYTGGSNYKGDIVDENGKELTGSNSYNGFPEPGFYITLPTALNNQLQGDATGPVDLSKVLSFVYDAEGQAGKIWTLQMYNPESLSNIAFSKYIYRMMPAEGQEPVRLQIEGDDGPISNDKLEDFGTNNLFETYTMSIYGGDVKTDAVKARLTISGVTQPCDIYVDSGVLTVRGTTESAETVAINDSTNDANGFQVTAENGNKYYINGSDIEVDVQNVHLLTDKLTGGQTQLQEKAETPLKNAGITETDGLTYDFMYLDLVDNSNGNAYVTLNQNNEDDTVTIHWPMPTNADPETIRVVHFDGLDRNYTDVDESIETCKTSVLETGRDKDGNITFTTYTFSPFALVYETKDPGTGPDTDPDDDKDDDDHYTGGGGNDNDSDPTGNLSIELDVNGGDDEFTFTVYFTDEDGDDLKNNFYFNGDFTGTIGSGDEITLEGGDKIVIRNLPEGTRYEVIIETADGYTYVIDGEEGIIRTGTNEAEFTATRTVPLADPSVTGVSRWLNVTDHIAYLTGYPGGAFGPDNSMTRAEVAQMFYALLNNKNVTITKTFPDVPANAWYATAVNTLASLGMVSGDANGNYRPNDPITRAEFCVIALAFAYEPDNAVCYFSDVSRSDWFYTYVAQAASYGWIGGYTNGNFGPNDRITRAQVTTIVNNMLGRAADRDYVIDHQADLVQFTDLNRTYWGYYQIMEATNAHDYTKSNGTENWR